MCRLLNILSEYKLIDKKFILIALGSFHDPSCRRVYLIVLYLFDAVTN